MDHFPRPDASASPDSPTPPRAPCGARKPGWELGPAIGSHRIPCVLAAGHDGDHRDGLGQTWPPSHMPPLDTARQVARRILAHYQGINPHDSRAVVEAFAATTAALATLLDALDGELPR